MLGLCLLMLETEEDKICFTGIYQQYKNDVIRRALILTRNHQDAEDIAQETWLYIAGKFDILHGKNDEFIKAYIMKITKYKALDSLKRNRKVDDVEYIDDDFDFAYNAIDATIFAVCQKEEVDIIFECINSLNEIYRDTLNLYYKYERTVKEISELMHLSQAATSERLLRGKSLLIQLLNEKIGVGNIQ